MTRNGKIARLPAAIREELNQRLLDGEQGKQLVEWLNSLPKVQAIMQAKFGGKPITKVNLSQWKNGGYAAWETGERLAAGVKAILDGTASLQKVAGHGLTDRLTLIMAAHMAVQTQVLEAMPEGSDKAKAWRELRIGLLSLRRSELCAQRLDIEREKHPKPEKKKNGPSMTQEEKRLTMMRLLGINEGYDGSIHPELTRPPAEFLPAPVQASTSEFK